LLSIHYSGLAFLLEDYLQLTSCAFRFQGESKCKQWKTPNEDKLLNIIVIYSVREQKESW